MIKMARFLLAVWPYTGHVFPNIALAHALRARGHEVAFYTGALARPVVEQEGFACFPFERLALSIARIVGLAGADTQDDRDTPQLYERLTNYYTAVFDQWPLARGLQLKAMYRDWILGTAPQQVEDLRGILSGWRPDVVVCDPFMWGPILILHETGAIPVAVFSYFAGCLLPGPDTPPFALGLPRPHRRWTRPWLHLLEIGKNFFFADLRRDANRMRRKYRLRPLSTTIMAFAGQMPLYLVASVPEFDYERRDLPPSVHYVGPCLWDKPARQPPLPWMDALSEGDPIIYVTEGTAHVRTPILLQAAAQGLAHLPMQVVMTTGRHRDPERLPLGPRASNVWVKDWVPHSDLFSKASVVITHGGSGTVLSALQAGLPLVIVPMQWDHLENAQRVVAARAGLCLPPRDCTPERLRTAVYRVLHEPSFRQNARRLAVTFRGYRGPERAAELLETLCAGRAEGGPLAQGA